MLKAVIKDNFCRTDTTWLSYETFPWGLGGVLKNVLYGKVLFRGPRDRSFITSQGGAVVLEGGTFLKQAPFWGVNFSLVRNMRGVKFYDTATAV